MTPEDAKPERFIRNITVVDAVKVRAALWDRHPFTRVPYVELCRKGGFVYAVRREEVGP